MGKPDAPDPPNPVMTAAAQTGTNVGTAIANSMLGMVDQYTPYGSLTYSLQGGGDPGDIPGIEEITTPVEGGGGFDPGGLTLNDQGDYRPTGTFGGPTSTTTYQVGDQTFSTRAEAEQYRNNLLNEQGGYYAYTDPFTGQTYQIPRFESTIELTPQQQETLDATQQAQTNLANLAQDRSDFLLNYLPQSESLTDEISNRLYDMGSQRLDPRFARQEEALRTRLAQQGIVPGSEAYNREMDLLGQSRNDAYNQLMLQGRGQALTEINTPINQITALLSGSQVTNPSVNMQQPAQIPTTDVAGIINQNYNQRLGAYNQQTALRGSLLGGLFGAGATLLGAPQGSILGGLL